MSVSVRLKLKLSSVSFHLKHYQLKYIKETEIHSFLRFHSMLSCISKLPNTTADLLGLLTILSFIYMGCNIIEG